jgi:hypothetical protein
MTVRTDAHWRRDGETLCTVATGIVPGRRDARLALTGAGEAAAGPVATRDGTAAA